MFLKLNILKFVNILKKIINNNSKIPIFLQLKYTFLPLLFIILFIYYKLDSPVENYIKKYIPNIVVIIFNKITDFGKVKYILVIICFILSFILLIINNIKLSISKYIFLKKIMTYNIFIFLSIVVSSIFGQILKVIIGRGRPKFFLKYGSNYFQHFCILNYDFTSMPSGHSIIVSTIFFVFLYIMPKLKYLWYFFIIIFAGSRVIIGSHYLSDVIFGIILSFYCTTYIYYWMKNIEII